jgi:hypothetical protein
LPTPRKKAVPLTKAELIARDLCENAAEIGAVIDKTERQATHLCASHQLPCWKRGGNWMMRPSRYFRHIEEMEDAAIAAMHRRKRAKLPRDQSTEPAALNT